MIFEKLFAFCILFALAGSGYAQNCYQSSIVSPTPFMGNNGEIFKLADGSFWEVKYEYEYLYEYYPDVVICPSKGKLAIKGKSLNVQQVGASGSTPPSSKSRPAQSADVIESQIDGDFNGWEGETIYRLRNGQIWQQASYHYHYHYAYAPKVLIYPSAGGYRMQVEGDDDEAISVRRIR